MKLFTKDSHGQVVIPFNRVYDIVTSSCSVFINYECGFVEDEGTYQKKTETARVVFDSPEDVDKIMRQFFKACRDGAKVFYFGKEKTSSNSTTQKKQKELIIPEVVDNDLEKQKIVENDLEKQKEDDSWLVKSLLSR